MCAPYHMDGAKCVRHYPRELPICEQRVPVALGHHLTTFSLNCSKMLGGIGYQSFEELAAPLRGEATDTVMGCYFYLYFVSFSVHRAPRRFTW